MMKGMALAPLLLLALFQVNSQSLPELLDQRVGLLIDSLDLPGISVSALNSEGVIFKKSYGFSNLEYQAPMTDSSLYRVWSVSKQFAAVSILKLMEEGKLELSDRIGMYLDTIPPAWEKITVRNLLNNTGGIKDYLNDFPRGRKLIATPYEVVRDSVADLKFEPGMGWSYTNSGFWVLTKVVESTAGIPYQEYISREFFVPPGSWMKDLRPMAMPNCCRTLWI